MSRPIPQRSRPPIAVAAALTLALAACRRGEPPPAAREQAGPPTVEAAGLDPAVEEVISQGMALVRNSPGEGKSWGILGTIYFAHDFRAEAIECLAKAGELEPGEPRWPYLRSLALLRSDADAGLAALRRAVELTGAAPSAPKLRLAELLIERGDLGEAEALTREVLELEPRNPRALLNLGRIHFARGELEASFEQLERSARLLPDARPTRVLLTTVAARLGRPDPGALMQPPLDELPAAYPWPDQFQEEASGVRRGREAEIERARVALEEQRYGQAQSLLERVTEHYPDSEQAWWMLGVAAQQQEFLDTAEKAFREAVRLAPDSFDARTRFGLFLAFSRSDPEAAREQLEAALELNPNSPTAVFNLALCTSEAGDYAEAIRGFRRTIELNPGRVEAQIALADALWKHGDEEAARRQLERSLELHPGHPQAEALQALMDASPDPGDSR